MPKKMFDMLDTAFRAGHTLQLTDWNDNLITATGAQWREYAGHVAFTAVNVICPTEAPVVEHADVGRGMVYVLTPDSATLMHRAVTYEQIKDEYRVIEPHLASIKEAYPDSKVYFIRDHRLRDIRDHTCPAVLVQYGESDDHQPGPMKYHGFSAWHGEKITYTEAEAWRYKPYIAE